ncbi:ABC transporter permease [Chroogloeocystis siderophila]|uniref:ABC transporter permease n=1 Tax=Chroogloeocystis siderophila 5.2 s.c.1 TaxID=247279 RepID=A0A1U7HHP0_9CHRO|nr:FtsX-like permease family protein [Chroogloeocystis siderophila]OKH23100.1 ABC transporter permease [Chroogloeocystis siderophila 5.2 s.c.1]
MSPLAQKLWRDLLHWRGQAIAIILVVACGIASFVSMLSAYHSLQLSQATYYEQYRFADIFVQLKRAPESFVNQIAAISGVAQLQTRVVMDVTLDIPQRDEPAIGRLISIPEQPSVMLNDLYLRQGRYIQAGRNHEVLVSEAFVNANQLQLGDMLGAVINGRWQSLQIVGIALSPEYIYEIRGAGNLFPDNERFGVLWIGREALATAFNMDGAFNDLTLSLMPQASQADIISQLDRLLAPYGGLGAYGREDQISHRVLSDEITQLQGTATVVPIVFLGIAAFLLHISLSRLVSTQREQIAVLKAFGYSNNTIGMHYFKFVLAIVLVGAIFGTGIGVWFGNAVTHTYAQFYAFPVLRYEARIELIIAAIVISGGAALFGAFIAVRRAVLLPPAEAMRPEPPAVFRLTLIERMGLHTWLSPVGRMIARNIERKPVQAFFAALGIALAIAMLVVGRYLIDAVEYMIDVQFRQVQREDITIVFNNPRPARVRYEVNRLPGVLSSEPFRSVAARLRFEHRSRRIAITGLEPTGKLRRLIDRQLNTVNLPPNGIVLTKALADILHIGSGDLLTVEVLEEERPIRTVPVVGFVDEMIGVAAYMDIHALNRLMQEGGTISGAFLAIDTNQTNQLYTLLKRTPAVTGISIRQAAIAQFQETIASSRAIFTTVLVIFACIIAFGVVYNSARIALSERSRELATLRIMGFSRAQVTVILLGEQAAIILFALPWGFVLGYAFSAFLSAAFESELYRIPLIITKTSYAFAFGVIAIAAIISGFIIRRQVNRLDLVAVLKTRE